MIIALSLVVGVTDALSMPSFQSIVPSIVRRDQIGRGLALNSTQFNLSRILGPAIAGVLMASIGAVACFALSAASYIPFIGVALWILPRRAKGRPSDNAFDRSRLLSGLREIARAPHLRGALLTVFATSVLCGPLITFTPVLVSAAFHGDAGDFSAAVGAFGVGGLLGATGLLAVPAEQDRRRWSSRFAVFYGLTVAFGRARSLVLGRAGAHGARGRGDDREQHFGEFAAPGHRESAPSRTHGEPLHAGDARRHPAGRLVDGALDRVARREAGAAGQRRLGGHRSSRHRARLDAIAAPRTRRNLGEPRAVRLRDAIWPGAEGRFPGDRKRKRAFDGRELIGIDRRKPVAAPDRTQGLLPLKPDIRSVFPGAKKPRATPWIGNECRNGSDPCTAGTTHSTNLKLGSLRDLALTHIKKKNGRRVNCNKGAWSVYGDAQMQTQSNIHFYVNWAKERLNEMEAVLTSLESKVGEVQADARDKANKALADLRKSRDIFRDTIKKQSEANEATWTSAKAKLEPEWDSFQAEAKKYVESFSKQVEQQQATFKVQSAAQLKAWREAADKLGSDAKQFATGRQAEIDAAVKRMQADAAAAEEKLQKHVDQMGAQSWSALMAVLAETRAAFDRANQAAREAFKRAA